MNHQTLLPLLLALALVAGCDRSSRSGGNDDAAGDSDSDTDGDTDTCDEMDWDLPDLTGAIECNGICSGPCFVLLEPETECLSYWVCNGACAGTCCGECDGAADYSQAEEECCSACDGSCFGACDGGCAATYCSMGGVNGECEGLCIGECEE